MGDRFGSSEYIFQAKGTVKGVNIKMVAGGWKVPVNLEKSPPFYGGFRGIMDRGGAEEPPIELLVRGRKEMHR
jgi:hypothetical protein